MKNKIMKNKSTITIMLTAALLSVVIAATAWIMENDTNIAGSDEYYETYSNQTTGLMRLGKYTAEVVYDEEQDYFFLELEGARFPFKKSPLQAINVGLDAPGENELEKNTNLLYGILGPDVLHVTLLINPDEEDDVMPAVEDLARYIKIVNPKKYAGFAYTKTGGKLNQSVIKGSQIQSLNNDSSLETPIIQIIGPKSGASETRVRVLGEGRFIVEGNTYEEVYLAADVVCITLIKMLCGSPDCPDAAACATGGDCGCS
jgi:hypothetical protein